MIKELNNPVLNEAIDVVESISRDPKVRELIRQKEYADHERASIWADGNETGLAQGRLEGRLEGIKEGRQDGIDSLAKELIAIGMDKAAVQEAIRRMEANGH